MTPDWIPVNDRQKPEPFTNVVVWLDIPDRYYGPAAAWWDPINSIWHTNHADDAAVCYITYWANIQPPPEE